MISIRYNSQLLDTDPDAALSFELNNLVFSSSDSTVLPGSFSFPFDLPATPRNLEAFNFPDRVDNAESFLRSGDCQVLFGGIEIFKGTLKLTEAGARLKAYIVANPLSTIKDVPLNELDLDGDRTFANAAAVLSHAKDTATTPLDYDYVFFPIWNREFISQDTGTPKRWFQNWYNSTTQAFSVDDDHPALMPFVRLDYILEKIFSGAEYLFENKWQISNELRQIVLYNNRSLWTSEGLDTTINLQNHVSKTGSGAFIRKVMGAFCLGLFYNPWKKVLRLIPIQSILSNPPRHDWTNKILHRPSIQSSDDQPEILCWKRDESDGAWEHYDKYQKPASIAGTKTWAELLAGSAGTYYITDRHAYYQKTATPRYFFKHQTLGCAPEETGKPVFEAECQALWDAFLYGEGQTAVTDGNYDLIPHCRIPGTVEYTYTPDVGDPEIVNQQNECPDRITIYRGMYEDFDGDDYPLASGIPWDGSGNLIGQYSLRWDGQYGMYETWWQGWHTMLRFGKNVSANIHLSISDLLEFSFEQKVRIRNMDYFVKKMRVSLTPKGLAPVECELVSVI